MRASRLRNSVVGALAVAAVGFSLAACGSGDGGDSPSSDPSGSAGGSADAAAEFFDGKTIKVIVPYNPGGGFDAFVRTLAPYLEESLDGAKVEVENQPGGGSLIGSNAIATAKPDGLTIGLINYPGTVFAEATGQDGVNYKTSDWTFLGRLGAINPLVYTGKDSGYESFQDVLDATEPVVFGIGGVGSDAYYATVVMSNVLGFPNKIIGGYPGSGEADAALLVGEVDASVNSIDAAMATVDQGAHPLALISTEPSPKLPDVPTITEFGDADQQATLTALASIYDLERILVAPPGLDDAKADFLANAVYEAATNPDYIKDLASAGYTANALSREDVVKLADEAQASIDTLTPILNEAPQE